LTTPWLLQHARRGWVREEGDPRRPQGRLPGAGRGEFASLHQGFLCHKADSPGQRLVGSIYRKYHLILVSGAVYWGLLAVAACLFPCFYSRGLFLESCSRSNHASKSICNRARDHSRIPTLAHTPRRSLLLTLLPATHSAHIAHSHSTHRPLVHIENDSAICA
jgi:hypothetical protein